MSDLQRWFMRQMSGDDTLLKLYAEQSFYSNLFPAQVTGLWRIH